jgi:hypothetical protein
MSTPIPTIFTKRSLLLDNLHLKHRALQRAITADPDATDTRSHIGETALRLPAIEQLLKVAIAILLPPSHACRALIFWRSDSD